MLELVTEELGAYTVLHMALLFITIMLSLEPVVGKNSGL